MIKTSSEIRLAAREALKGHWTEAAMFTFVYYLVAFGFSSIVSGALGLISEGLTLIASLALIPLAWGFMIVFLLNARGKDDPFNISNMFAGYKDAWRIFTTYLLYVIYTMLWTLLLIIPGIIKGLSYSMTNYILYDYPELKNNAAIELSMKMMEGHKAELFWLSLTFIGWAILCIFTLGIGYFWLIPYVQASMAEFYEEVKKDYYSKQA